MIFSKSNYLNVSCSGKINLEIKYEVCVRKSNQEPVWRKIGKIETYGYVSLKVKTN